MAVPFGQCSICSIRLVYLVSELPHGAPLHGRPVQTVESRGVALLLGTASGHAQCPQANGPSKLHTCWATYALTHAVIQTQRTQHDLLVVTHPASMSVGAHSS